MVDLYYNIATCRLKGSLDGKNVDNYAVSGGRAGTKTLGAQNLWLSNNVFATNVKLQESKKNEGSSGGPLPQGIYTLLPHEEHENWIRLIPFKTTLPEIRINGKALKGNNWMQGRSGFAIHGRGPRGSDGCIVIPEFEVVIKIYKQVDARSKNGAKPFVLKVYAEGQDLDKMFYTA